MTIMIRNKHILLAILARFILYNCFAYIKLLFELEYGGGGEYLFYSGLKSFKSW